MKVYVVSAFIFVLCNTLGSAQGPRPGPTAAQKAQLFQKNYTLIEKLVDNSLKLTKQTDPLSRSENFRSTFLEMEQQILGALREGDKNRLAELSDHLKSLSERGLLPTVGKARENISQNHPNEPRLFEVRDTAERIFGDLQLAIAQSGVADSLEAKQLKVTLQQTKEDLEKRMEIKEKDEAEQRRNRQGQGPLDGRVEIKENDGK